MRNFKARRKRRNHWDAEQASCYIQDYEIPDEDRPDWPEDDDTEL